MLTKTINTPDTPEMLNITFTGARISEFGRVDSSSGWIKFHCQLGSTLNGTFAKMGWDIPGSKTKSEKLEGKLNGGRLALISKEKLVDAELDMEYVTISDFECLRLELEQKKGKCFRRELRFNVTFKAMDGAALLESYQNRSDNARGALKVSYLKEAEQAPLPLTDTDRLQDVQ